jgi:hypothetical protein
MYKFVLFLSVSALLMGGCTTGSESGSDSDTGPGNDTTPTIANFSYVSADAGGTWSYEVDIDGWADAVVLDITENSDNPWAESHDLEELSFTKDPFTDIYTKDLPAVKSCNDQTNNVNTCFDTGTEPHMVWMFTAFVKADAISCGVFAYDGNLGDFAGYDCIEFGK